VSLLLDHKISSEPSAAAEQSIRTLSRRSISIRCSIAAMAMATIAARISRVVVAAFLIGMATNWNFPRRFGSVAAAESQGA
jgi:hypothetical protein